LSALRARDFRLLWLSQSASVIGDALVIVAIGLYVTRLTGDRSRWRPRRPMLAGMLAAVPWPATIALYGAGPPVLLVYAGTTVAGAGIGLFAVWWETALPPHPLSRVSAWDWMGSLALLPLGYLLAGPVEVLVGGGLFGTVSCALGLLPRSTRTLTRLKPEAVVVDLPIRHSVP